METRCAWFLVIKLTTGDTQPSWSSHLSHSGEDHHQPAEWPCTHSTGPGGLRRADSLCHLIPVECWADYLTSPSLVKW